MTVLLFFFGNNNLLSQTSFASEYQVKAVFLFNFSHFITWPNNAFEDQYSTFIILRGAKQTEPSNFTS